MIDRMLPLFALPIIAVLIVLIFTTVPLLNKRRLPPFSLLIAAGILTWALGEILVNSSATAGYPSLLPAGLVIAASGSILFSLTLISAGFFRGTNQNRERMPMRPLATSLVAGSVLSAVLLVYLPVDDLPGWTYLAVLVPLNLWALILLIAQPGMLKPWKHSLPPLMALVALLAAAASLLWTTQTGLILSLGLLLLAGLYALQVGGVKPSDYDLQAMLPVETSDEQAVLLLDENNLIEAATEQAGKILGLTPQKLHGRFWQSVQAEFFSRGGGRTPLDGVEGDLLQIRDHYYRLEFFPVDHPDGKNRRLLHLQDYTVAYHQIRTSDEIDRLLQTINELPVLLKANPSLQDGTQQSLEHIGKTVRAGRIYLMKNSHDPNGMHLISLVAEWCDPKVPPRIRDPKLQDIPYHLSRFGEWEKALSERQIIQQHFDAGRMPSDDTLIAPECRSLLLAPVFSGKEWWGILGVESYEYPILQSNSEIHLLQTAADHLGAALQVHTWENTLRQRLEKEVKERTNELLLANSRLELELKRRELAEAMVEKNAQQLLALHEASNALLVNLDLEPLLGRILDAAMSAIPNAKKGALHMIAKDTGQLEMRAVLGFSDTRIRRLYGQDRRGVLARAVYEKRPILVNDTRGLDEQMPVTEAFESETVRSLIISPLIADQETLGALSLAAPSPESFDENDLQVLTSFATTATLALRNAQLHAAVQKMAITDALTQIYNRRGFIEIGERLFESARRFRHPLTAIALDLDFFKEVNDKFGHNTGDQALQFFAELMMRSLRKVDLVGRMGGDEFSILLPETDIFHAVQVGERIRKKTELSTFPTSQGSIKLTVSLGIAKLSTQTAELEELLNRADKALYESKHSGRNRSRMFPLESRMPDLIPPA